MHENDLVSGIRMENIGHCLGRVSMLADLRAVMRPKSSTPRAWVAAVRRSSSLEPWQFQLPPTLVRD